jgi:hypothetical protein
MRGWDDDEKQPLNLWPLVVFGGGLLCWAILIAAVLWAI